MTLDIVKDAVRLLTGTTVAMVISLAVSPLLTRLFTPIDFGIYSYLLAFITMFSALISLRLEMIIPVVKGYTSALILGQCVLILGAALAFGLLLLIWIFHDVTHTLFPQMVGLSQAIYYLPFLLFAYAAYTTARALALREKLYREIGRAQIARAAMSAALWLGLGFFQLFAAEGVALIVGHLLADLLYARLLFRILPEQSRAA